MQAVPSIFGIIIVTFLLTRALPGDPAVYFAGPAADEQSIQEIRESLGLDKPLIEQFWIYLTQLAKGEFNGQRLIREETLQETWNPQITMGPGNGSYGLGWMLQDWNDQPVIQHGGNIDGFGAQVALLPEENLGFVLLTNVTATPLQQGSIPIVFEALVGPLPSSDQSTSVDTSKLVGTYDGNFGALKDLKLKVLLNIR